CRGGRRWRGGRCCTRSSASTPNGPTAPAVG
ncbi:MAG: hypothetical protein AVDCRST_MAG64-1193, partial [uncultured Phycisphaerae bacterium]